MLSSRLQIAIFDGPGGAMLADYSARASDLVFSTNEHGYEALSAPIPILMEEAFRLYDRPGLPHVEVNDSYGSRVWEGRLEDPSIWGNAAGGGLQIGALGYVRAATDTRYTALWSTTSVADFSPLLGSEVAGRTPEKFSLDTNNRLFVGLQKNATYANLADAGGLKLRNLDRGSRSFVGFEVAYQVNLPLNWKMELNARDGSYGSQVTLATVVGTGALISGALNLAFGGTPRDVLSIEVYNNTGAGVTYAGETGATYAKITSLRIVTTIANRINTTLGTAIAAGTRTVTPPVGGMARIFVGQRLIIGGAVSEAVTVTAITSTTFTAVFAQAHVAADTVQAFVITADLIAKDLVTTINALNSGQISANTDLIQSPGLDLTDEIYEDELPSDILTYLAALGDTQSPPRRWEAAVWEGRVLVFRPQNTAGRTWFVDIAEFEVKRSLEDMANSAYAVYQAVDNQTLRIAAVADATSIAVNGVTRRAQISASTTSATQAGLQRDAYLQDHKDPFPTAQLSLPPGLAVYDAAGCRAHPALIRAGDTIGMRNLPAIASTALDRVRFFRITHTEYRPATREPTIEPERPLATLETLLARAAIGVAPSALPLDKNL